MPIKYSDDVKHRAQKLVEKARARARRKNMACEITWEWVAKRLHRGVCERTGLRFEGKGVTAPWTASLDRFNSKSGYTLTNTQVVVWQYNRAKGDLAEEDFFKFCRHIVDKYNIKKPL